MKLARASVEGIFFFFYERKSARVKRYFCLQTISKTCNATTVVVVHILTIVKKTCIHVCIDLTMLLYIYNHLHSHNTPPGRKASEVKMVLKLSGQAITHYQEYKQVVN